MNEARMDSSKVRHGQFDPRGLQERVARALPAERTERLGGWWLRHTSSASWWLGTVLAHDTVMGTELATRISVAERFYTDLGARTRFQITPGASPEELDAALAARGYVVPGRMSLCTASTADVCAVDGPGAPRVRLDSEPGPDWFEVWYAVHGGGGDRELELAMLGRVTMPSAYVCAMLGDSVVAVGRGVAESGWVGVFGMATLPEARGHGAARAVLLALAEWARARRAEGMYLQVEAENPALRLYERMSFAPLCQYHYRAQPVAGALA